MSQNPIAIALPQEIYELFIDTLGEAARDDRQSRRALIQCSRVCRVFWIHARRKIFSQVRISECIGMFPVSVLDRLAAFLSLIASSGPRSALSLGKLVKSFTMVTIHEPIENDVKILSHPMFVTLLQELARFKVLESLNLLTKKISWLAINPHTQQALQTLCQTSHLKTLSLPKVDSIPADFFDGITLKHLALHDASNVVVQWDSLPSPPPLESLEVIGLVYNIPAPPSNPLLFCQLSRLASTISDPRNLASTYSIAQRSPFLQTLSLIFSADAVIMSARPLDFSQLPKLSHLKLSMNASRDSPSITDICQFIPSASTLQNITIEIRMLQDIRHPPKSLERDPWRALDKALAKARIPRVHLELHVLFLGMFYGSRFVESDFVKNMKELLEPLLARTRTNNEKDFTIDVVADFRDPRGTPLEFV